MGSPHARVGERRAGAGEESVVTGADASPSELPTQVAGQGMQVSYPGGRAVGSGLQSRLRRG